MTKNDSRKKNKKLELSGVRKMADERGNADCEVEIKKKTTNHPLEKNVRRISGERFTDVAGGTD